LSIQAAQTEVSPGDLPIRKMSSPAAQNGPRRPAKNRLTGKRNRAAREHALLTAAARLFATRGYDVTTTREIAAQAGCSEGLIHRYFANKSGLLFALIQSRVSREVAHLGQHLKLARTLEEEFQQLLEWELDHMWQDRDFLRVIIPRAMLDPSHARLLRRVGTSRHVPAIMERLRKFKQCRSLPPQELEALAQFLKVLGLVYGFLHPTVLRHDRDRSRKTATTIAKMLVRSL